MKPFNIIILLIILSLVSACSMRPLIKHTPSKPGDSLFERAEEKFREGEYDAALKDYGRYLEKYPDQQLAPAALLKTGAIHTAMGNYGQARETFRVLIRQYPESSYTSDGMVEILVTYYHEGLYEDVISYSYEIPEDMTPSDYLIRKYAIVGDAFMALGATVDAVDSFITAYTKAEPLEQKSIVSKLMKALSGLAPEEMEHLQNQADTDAVRGFVVYQQSLNYMKDGRNDDALKLLSAFLSDYPDHIMADEARNLKDNFTSTGFNSNLVGCLLPISGKYESYGVKAQMGFDLAYNNFCVKNNDFSMRVIYRDTESDPEKTREAVKELAELGVAAIVGPVGTVESAAEEAQLRGIPIITFTGKESITLTGDYVFRNFITRKMQVESVVSYAFEVLGLNHFAIMYPDEDYGRDLMNLFWDQVNVYGGDIVGVESYKPGSTDFAKPIKRLINDYYALSEVPSVLSDDDNQAGSKSDLEEEEVPEGPVVDFDAVFIPDSSEKLSLILPQLSFYDVGNVYLLGTNLWHHESLTGMAEISALGSVIPDGFFPGSNAPEVVDFMEGFQKAFDEMPGFIEAVAYDSAMIVLETLRSGGMTSQGNVRDSLLELSDYQGVTGVTSFDDTGDVIKALYLLQVEKNGFVELKR